MHRSSPESYDRPPVSQETLTFARLLKYMLLSGLHNETPTYRLRLFYLFHRFVKEARNDLSPDICVNIIESIRDVLTIEVQIPEPDEVEIDPLTDAVKSSTFDSQLYLYETTGTLCTCLPKESDQQGTLLLSCVKPLMANLSDCLQVVKGGSQEVVPIVHTHHIIMALGNIAKGFPDYPSPVPSDFLFPLANVFSQIAQAILICLEAMNIFKVVRDAVCSSFSASWTYSVFSDSLRICTYFGYCWSSCHTVYSAIDVQSPGAVRAI